MRILQAVVRCNRRLSATPERAPNPGMYNEVLRRAARLATHDFLVCSISDGYGTGPESAPLVTRILGHNDLLVLFVYDPVEAALPRAGRLVLGSRGRLLEIDSHNPGLRRRFASSFSERSAAIEHFCRQRATPRLAIETGRDVAEQVRERLGHASGTGD